MPSAQVALVERHLIHALTLERLKAGEVQEVLRQMKRLERDLVRDLEKANLTSFRKDRYERLLQQARETLRGHYKTIRDTQQEKLEQVVGLEGAWTVQALNRTISDPVGVYLDIASVKWTLDQIRAIAGKAVIDNEITKSWWAKQATDTRRRFADTVKQGLLRGSTTPEIVRLVRQDVLPVSRQQAEALVRSSIQTVTHEARRETYIQNEDLIKGIQQISTLDTRTSIICVAYSRKQFDNNRNPIGHNLPYKNGVPRHFQCRSTEVAVLKSFSELSGKPLPQADNQTIDNLFRARLASMGWDEDRIAAARRRTQSSLDGQISSEITFQNFLTRKGVGFQDQVLGKGKADLFRRGIVRDIAQLLNFKGNPLTLQQLKAQFGVGE